jgi:hypothetical protein
VIIHLPKATATLALNGADSSGVVLLSDDGANEIRMGGDAKSTLTIHVPPGQYRVVDPQTGKPHADLPPIDAQAGKTTSLLLTAPGDRSSTRPER